MSRWIEKLDAPSSQNKGERPIRCFPKQLKEDFVGYVVAQVAGAVAGSALLYAIIDSTGKAVTSLGQNGFGAGYGIGITALMAFVVEIVLTFVFVYAILGVTSESGNGRVAGLVIGLTLAFVHILGIGLTGTSVNPARSFGPAVLLGGEAWSELWVFVRKRTSLR
ncbi:MIP/aquaporin family protein [Paenibacillus puerhi]|uniref:MIP/aquaporin family protein n=1 Tax=Paenibacillus puerhi TaxID=2692622 RepID=UPI00135B4FBD|nr:aquaporin [Paenibacillus puerhi]